ncbi:ATP synthase F0 subunit C [bacterium]|jgi:F-type H+-transporting ATPase subunit c|nr:ATP synthase F0 subunit C [bacterium]MBT3580838.1 ATP synthase F0 subunit C [bacterium]MBT4552404.1 ATP synthase F0 subunit C [bacterium]MBT5989074.1 ATP synthase F0 subunit C [bacterium]MBT7088457.1 ATP synthase F0 subunit C [bacterium]
MEGISGADLIKVVSLAVAGITMAIGSIGPSLGEGFVAAKACEALGKRPDQAEVITRTMLIGQAVTETTGIYCLVIALILIFVV